MESRALPLGSNRYNSNLSFQAAIKIDFDKLKPAYLAVEKPDLSQLTPEQIHKILMEEMKPSNTDGFPGYKPGTLDLSGQ